MELLAKLYLHAQQRFRSRAPSDRRPGGKASHDLRRRGVLVKSLGAALAIALSIAAPRAAAQETSEAPVEETVVNLAAGRVVIAVVKDAILIGTVENPIETATRPPTPVEIASLRAGVILGAVQWLSPSSQQEIARLDQELPRLHGRQLARVEAPHLQAPGADAEATDLESIGQGLLDRLNEVAQNLHGKVDLPAGEPLAELILADYLPSYGPEVWQLSYAMKQQEERIDYWTTQVLRPSYLQFWPPDKGQPHTLIEFAYPPESPPPTLLELLRQKDPRLEKIRASDAKLAQVADAFLRGDTSKLLAADTTQFLRAALDAIAPPNARETMALVAEQTGFAWILPPPPEPKAPPSQTQPQSQRPPGAPSLLHPPQ
jgi:hypothetical protein